MFRAPLLRRASPRSVPRRRRQSGAVLIVALFLLVVLTLLAVASAHRTTLRQKISANFYDREMAVQADEAAVRLADAAIGSISGGVGPFVDCSPSRTATTPCLSNPFNDPNLPAGAITTVPSTSYNPGPLAPGQPQYVVQFLGLFPDTAVTDVKQVSNCAGYGSCVQPGYYNFYRVTARSSAPAGNGRAVVTVQSVFRR